MRMLIGHALDNKKLTDIQPIHDVEFDIASRTDHFFQKRDISRNKHFIPSHPKNLQYDDSLRLKIKNIYNNNLTIHLHLQPNYDLFHPDSVLTHSNKSVQLIASDYRVYQGYVVDPVYSDQLWSFQNTNPDEIGVLGWARITIRNDRERKEINILISICTKKNGIGKYEIMTKRQCDRVEHDISHPLFEGVFVMNTDTYHVKLIDNYHLTKRSDDALTQNNEGHMVIYRDSDLIDDGNGTSKECGFDSMIHPTSSNPYSSTRSSLFKRTNTQGCPKTKKSKGIIQI